MMITDVICEAATEREVCFLLSAYVEAVRYGDKLGSLPEPVRRLPIAGIDDLRSRTGLLGEICMTATQRDAGERSVMNEAREIFAAALGRLGTLEQARGERLSA